MGNATNLTVSHISDAWVKRLPKKGFVRCISRKNGGREGIALARIQKKVRSGEGDALYLDGAVHRYRNVVGSAASVPLLRKSSR